MTQMRKSCISKLIDFRMENQKIFFKISLLLQIAGFLVMLFLGFLGLSRFLAGFILYVLGVILACRAKAEDDRLQFFGLTTLGLFLVNLVFYSSIKLLPFVDVSYAIYWLLLATLLLFVYLRRSLKGIDGLILPRLILVAIFLVSIALSAINASHLKEVIYFFSINLGALVFYYSVINFSPSFSAIVKVVKLTSILGIASAVVALWQLYSSSFKFFYYPFISLRDQLILELWEVVSRMVGTWQHPSYLGMFLALTVCLMVYLIFYASKNLYERFFWGCGIVLTSSVLLLTNTRSSVLEGFLGIVLFYALYNFSKTKFFRLAFDAKKIVVLGLLLSFSLLLYQFVYVQEIYRKPQAWRVDASATIWGRFLRSDTMSSESLVQRSQLYSLAWDEFKARPVFGMGAKNFQYAAEIVFKKGTDAHNLIIQTAAEMGVVGVIAIIFLYGSMVWAMLKQFMSFPDSPQKYFQAMLFSLVLLILFDSFFNNPLYSLRILAIFWLAIGLQQVNFQEFHDNAQS